MARNKKTVSDKEKALLDIISDAKKKLSKLQDKQKNQLGELAQKCGLAVFDLDSLEEEFRKLASTLSKKS